MTFMWFMSLGFDMVDLFDEWVYGFTNGGYLRFIYIGNLGVLGSIMWELVNLIFLYCWVYLELVEDFKFLSW